MFVIWAVDGWFPLARAAESDDEIEEERRLMYVAMTRARNHLAVTYPLNVYSSRRSMDYSIDQLSRFVDRGVREQMERVVLGDDDKADTTAPPPVPGIADRPAGATTRPVCPRGRERRRRGLRWGDLRQPRHRRRFHRLTPSRGPPRRDRRGGILRGR